jgi:hypothetical protein
MVVEVISEPHNILLKYSFDIETRKVFLKNDLPVWSDNQKVTKVAVFSDYMLRYSWVAEDGEVCARYQI